MGLLVATGSAVADAGVSSSESNSLFGLHTAEPSVGSVRARENIRVMSRSTGRPVDAYVRGDLSGSQDHSNLPDGAAVMVRTVIPELGALALSGLAGAGLFIHRRRMWRV